MLSTITTTDATATLDTLQAQAKNAATIAQQAFLAKWVEQTGGNEYGEPMY